MKKNGVKKSGDLKKYAKLIRKVVPADYRQMFRPAREGFPYPFLTPGSDQYNCSLWDWDSWLTDVALRQVLQEAGSDKAFKEALPYERGCVLNFLEWGGMDGYIPITRSKGEAPWKPADIFSTNMHKPVLAQHAAFLVKRDNGDAEWLRAKFLNLQLFLNNYRGHHRHECGLYFWQDDACTAGDNDPGVFFRPKRSSGSIFLNCLMYRELLAMEYLCRQLNLDEVAVSFSRDAGKLKAAVLEHCWDDRDGFFYSVDLNLKARQQSEKYELHSGTNLAWPCLIQRLGVWSGFLALWAGIATPEQAARVVQENYRDTRTFNAPFGVRTLSKMEKMYEIRGSANPSCWLGPVWGISNYLVFRGLVKYGFEKDARELAEKTVRLFGRDLQRFGALHEYYQPENGEPVLNRGFQNWNYLVLNMLAWMEGKKAVEEF